MADLEDLGGEGLEAPPLKRPRLEASSLEAMDPGTPVDDLDDLYDTPSNANTPRHQQIALLPAPVESDAPDQRIPDAEPSPHLGIPGLGLIDHSQFAPANINPTDAAQALILPRVADHVVTDKSSPLADSESLKEFESHDGTEVIPPEKAPDVLSIAGQDPTPAEQHVPTTLLNHPNSPQKTPGTDQNLSEQNIDHSLQPVVHDVVDLPATLGASSTPVFLAPKTQDGGQGEWQFTSSDAQTSSSGESSTTSGSSSESGDEDAEEDYELLDPEEQARILMQDAGSDEEGAGSLEKRIGMAAKVKTTNEVDDAYVPKPDVTITPDLQIEELGVIESIVENAAVVKAKVSGDYQVLESGSILCLSDRSVIGVVAETLGRVQQPRYSVRFNSQEDIVESRVFVGEQVFYVRKFASYVFTQPLKAMKGSDASNLHDEEVGDDEREFSDDEAETEYKRRLKLEKRSRRGGRNARKPDVHPGSQRVGDISELSYDEAPTNAHDGEEGELYTPLQRPSNYHEIMQHGQPSTEGRKFNGDAKRNPRGMRGQTRGEVGRRSRGGRGNRHHRPDGPSDGHDQGAVSDSHTVQARYMSPLPQTGYGYGYANDSPHAQTGLPQYQSQLGYGYGYPNELVHAQPSIPHYPPTPPAQQQFSSQQLSPQFPNAWAMFTQQAPQYTVGQPVPQAYYAQQPPSSPGADLPPGSFVNPAFFRNTQPVPNQSHWSPVPNLQSPPLPVQSSSTGVSRMSPDSDAAFRAAQEKLDILRNLSRRTSGSP
ncbi:MAG: hypothetical protein M1833_000496 [Piccolia ochrophora]|nr:MAG: hypothetical protein M1833_000496 [Piccolia ochrophora]